MTELIHRLTLEPLTLRGRSVSRMEIASEGAGLNKVLRLHFRDPRKRLRGSGRHSLTGTTDTVESKLLKSTDGPIASTVAPRSGPSKATRVPDLARLCLRGLEEREPPEKARHATDKRAKTAVTARYVVERKVLRDAEAELEECRPRTCCFQHVWRNGEDFYDYYAKASALDPLMLYPAHERESLAETGAHQSQLRQPGVSAHQSQTRQPGVNKRGSVDSVPGESAAIARKRVGRLNVLLRP